MTLLVRMGVDIAGADGCIPLVISGDVCQSVVVSVCV